MEASPKARKSNTVKFGGVLQSIQNTAYAPAVEALLKSDGGETLSGFHYEPEERILDVTAWAEEGIFVHAHDVI